MATEIQLPKISEEEALSVILSYLRQANKNSGDLGDMWGYSHDLYIPDVVSGYWKQSNPNAGSYKLDTHVNAEPFYDAAWNLCTRGILRPWVIPNPGKTPPMGNGFDLTEYGKEWLKQVSGYETIPSEYGRFSELLKNFSGKFGDGYHVRSQEAVRCYRAHTYLACCVMCGGAAESILLALAIAKTGDEERIIKGYKTNTGRTKLENLLLSHANSHVKSEFPNYMNLLKYWRDESAHGESTNISEGEAFMSLLLLYRFAQFSNDRWTELTTK
jgi:hypothetical protein